MSSLNQRSTRFTHELEVGVKCRCQRRRSLCGIPFRDLVVLCGRTGCPARRGPRARAGTCSVDVFEEPQHVVRGVALAGIVEHLAGGDVHRREQVDRAVALVVVGEGAGATGLHRQGRLGAVECLDLGLLVEGEHDCPGGRIHVQPDDVDELLLEAGIVRDLERVDLPRPQVVVPPRSAPPCPCRCRAARPSAASTSASIRPSGRSHAVSGAPRPRPCRRAGTACGLGPSRSGRRPTLHCSVKRRRQRRTESRVHPAPPARSPRLRHHRQRAATAFGPGRPCDAATTSRTRSAPTPHAVHR